MNKEYSEDLEIELLTDVCITASNRSLGDPDMAEVIPGRVLWGAAASRMYREPAAAQEAFRIFYQGSVRITDAVPVLGEERAYPVPRSWHTPKGSSGSEQVYNFAREDVRARFKDEQCKPVSDGWRTATGQEVTLQTAYTLRTSIDASGRARDGLLYGLPLIRAGERFVTRLSGVEQDVEKVVRLLTAEDLRIGRSRNAELGLARCSRRKNTIGTLKPGQVAGDRISLLCVSRCLLREKSTGAPTLVPYAAAFGLPAGWLFDETSSFIRGARIVHFNSKRCRPESDRYAIERGSVITFRNSGGAGPTSLPSAVGEHRGEGYGEILVSPEWLTVDSLTFKRLEHGPEVVPAQAPTDELFQWAGKRATARQNAVQLYKLASDNAKELKRYKVHPAQWGAIHTMARQARFARTATLRQDLAKFLGEGARKLSTPWKHACNDFLRFCDNPAVTDLPLYLEHLASACMRPEGSEA